MSVNSAFVEGRQGVSRDQDENTENRTSFLCVFHFNVKNETIENADFKMFLEGGHCPSLAGCKPPAAVRVYPSPSKNL